MEGRDTGSVVFPDADVKFYLDADINERAKRRHLEQAARAEGDDFQKVKEQMERRDRDDSERDIAPLVRPEGAVYVDTTGKGIDEVVEMLRRHVEQARMIEVIRTEAYRILLRGQPGGRHRHQGKPSAGESLFIPSARSFIIPRWWKR